MTREELKSKIKRPLSSWYLHATTWILATSVLVIMIKQFLDIPLVHGFVIIYILVISAISIIVAAFLWLLVKALHTLENNRRNRNNRKYLLLHVETLPMSRIDVIWYKAPYENPIVASTEKGYCYPDEVKFVNIDFAYVEGKVLDNPKELFVKSYIYDAVLYLPLSLK